MTNRLIETINKLHLIAGKAEAAPAGAPSPAAGVRRALRTLLDVLTGQFNIPLSATTGADCALYVANSGNFRIQKFDANGNFLLAFGANGPAISKAVGAQWQCPAKPPQLPVTPR